MFGYVFVSVCFWSFMLRYETVTAEKQLGESCSMNAPCSDSNAECNVKCVCKDGFYDSTGTGDTGGTCTPEKALGAVCPSPSTSGVSSSASCSDTNAACQQEGGTYRCRCSSSYYDSDGNINEGGQCTYKVELGYECPMQDACLRPNSACVGTKCVCTRNYYDSNKVGTLGGTCRIREELGASCTTTWPYNKDQCEAQSATCIDDKCACDPGYHKEGLICEANNANGEACTGSVSDECSDPNAQCTNLKCTCGINFYDDDGLDIGGKCEPVSQLQVGSFVFSEIQTTSVTVSWSHPTGDLAPYVNYYSVRWTLKNMVNYNQSNNLPSSTTKYVVTGITPGKAYQMKVESHNTQTETEEERTTSSVTKQQAAKPNMVGGITSSENDLDVSDGTLRLAFTAANNGKSGYIVQLFNDTTKIAEKTASQSSTGVNIKNNYDVNSNHRPLKNGYRYNVRIITQSETFDNGNKVRSDVFEDVIKTTPKIPNQPESGQCGDVKDNEITVSWNPPAIPNGDIVRYHVWVYLNNKHNFTRSTNGSGTGLIVDGLQPGTSYQFTLVTQNEVGNSSQTGYISNGCKTNAKMAEAPNNVQLLDVTSRSMNVTWEKPSESYSEENFGYYLQIKNDKDTCVIEILFQCSDCNFGIFQFSQLTDVCTTITQQTEYRTKEELAERMSYSANLDPDILYTVTVTAINGAGRGYEAVANETTLEEAPKTPTSVSISDIGSNSLTVSWSIDGPRPGKTTFDIKVDANSPATSMKKSVEGFYNRSFVVTGLQEYWYYSVSVIAKTSKGSMESEVHFIRTVSAAPGKVSEFTVTPHPGGNYTQMKVSWKAPTILERNGIIKEYILEHNATGGNVVEKYSQEINMEHVYVETLSVTPGTYYRLQVTAVNEQDETGDPFEQIVEAVVAFDGGWSGWSGWSICTVTCDGGSHIRTRTCTNPVPKPGGSQCNGDGTETGHCHTQFCPVIPYGDHCTTDVGADKCAGDNTACRGGTCQCVAAVSNPDSQSSSDMKAIIVGVVLGVVILILVVYSGLLTLKQRRCIANKEQIHQTESIRSQQPTYMNEQFLNVTTPDDNIEGDENPAADYSTLSDETREAKSTYDIIRMQKD